jgi:hypothetical protein
MDAKVYFERRAVDDDELRAAIPELLKVIEDLRSLRQSERQTDDYLNKWLRSKRKEYVYLPLPTGEIVECENRDMDMTLFYRFNEWLFSYFHKLYKEKTGKTIGYAYALDTLTVYYNRFMADKFKVPYEKTVDRPNTDIDDVAEAIEAEDKTYQSIPAAGIQSTQQQISQLNQTVGINTDKPQGYLFKLTEEIECEIIKNYYFWKNLKAENKNNNAYKNIFEGFTQQEFLEMVCTVDFSRLKKTGCKYRIRNNISILSRIMDKEWGEMAAKSLNTTLKECCKRTDYIEYEQLKNLYK